jgi:Na+-translocating ferredoxin:NAD+ oxidoreductase RnfG subunit
MWDKLKIALVLVVIGALSGIIIYGVNYWTEEEIDKNRIATEQGLYRDLFNIDETEITESSIPVLLDANGLDEELIMYDGEGTVLGYIYKATLKNNYGEVTVLVGITTDGVLSNAVISRTTNTINFVQRIKSKYIGNFSNQDVTDIQIDSKTGATYTYTAVVDVVTSASEYYLESRGE